jgi:hypothetical protein
MDPPFVNDRDFSLIIMAQYEAGLKWTGPYHYLQNSRILIQSQEKKLQGADNT